MELVKSIIILVIGFALLMKGADYFVEGSSSVAKRLYIPSMIIGMTIVAMGTSLPECAVSVTASLAQKQGKKVFVIPHEINDKHGVGTNRLIRKGAILITKTKEIIDEFEFLKYKEIHEYETKINEKIKAKIKFENKMEE